MDRVCLERNGTRGGVRAAVPRSRCGKSLISTEGGSFPTWSRTKGELLYVRTPAALRGQIMVVPYRVEGGAFRAEKPRLWSDGRVLVRGTGAVRTFDLHPDGRADRSWARRASAKQREAGPRHVHLQLLRRATPHHNGDDPMSLTLGIRLGPYKILSAIGAGGMGEVYRARDTRLDRTVAVKVLPTHVSGDPAVRERFEREARTVASLNHPHICTLHDIGHQDGIDFLVLEYLEGETLADRLAKKRLSVDETLAIAIQIADALDKAHRAGIVHRDLKPGNI